MSEEPVNNENNKTFADLGVCDALCSIITSLGWKNPTPIQQEALPIALKGHDIIGLAETGSGKTGAFVIPILQSLLDNPQKLYGLILTPTRELAVQISEQIDALGSSIGTKCVVIVGGIDMTSQAIALAKGPHIIIATPGRIVDHIKNTKGFSLKNMKFLVLDEADRMLSMDFETEINQILEVAPKDRNTYLFSATMTQKVDKLQKASLKDPIKVEVSNKYQTYLFIPAKYKDCYLAFLLNEFPGQTVIVFVSTCNTSQKTTLMLRNLGFNAICLHGQMNQSKRLSALNKFKSGDNNILLATDVAARGLDIPNVDIVINYDIPTNGKEYIHRVGRTARAGKSGKAINIVTQYDVETYQRIEFLIGKKLDEYKLDETMVLVLLQRVTEAQRYAALQIKENDPMKRKGRDRKNNKFKNKKMKH